MSPQRWKRLKSLYGRASDLTGAERSRFVARVSGSDPSLAGELRGLLQRADDGSWLRSPLDPPPSEEPDEPEHFFPAGFELGGRYRIDSFLGAGGMGEVYRAHDRDTAEFVAIKVLRSGLAAQSDLQRRLRREVSLARRIPHVNICRVFDLQRAAGPSGASVLFLTMELLAGETLQERLRRGPLGPVEAHHIAAQLIEGLASAHANGIVHRDLKDANVMLVPAPDGQCRAVITDFGLAREQDSSGAATAASATGAIVGTAAYMAPEQLQGAPAAVASDIYGLGVILFKMATGRLPFEGDTALAVALRRLQSAAPSPRDFAADVDPRWETAIVACLDADPARRPHSADEVRSILEGRTSPPVRRSRRWFLVGGAAAAVCAAASVLWRPRAVLNPEAVRRFKLAEEFVRRRSAADLVNAVQEYQRAVELEPQYADAWAGLAEALSATADFDVGSDKDSREKARAAAETAVRLNGRSARAVGILGYCVSIDVDNWTRAEPYLRRAVDLDPRQANSRLWYGAFLGKIGRSREGIEQLQAGLAEEPASLALNQQLASEYLVIGENRKALDAAGQVVRVQPFQGNGYLVQARAYDALGDWEQALQACDKAAAYMQHPNVDAVRGTILVSLGRLDEARQIAARLDDLWRRGQFASQMLARLYARLGDRSRALELLAAGLDRKEASIVGCFRNPAFRPYFEDPAFLALARRAGLDPAAFKAYKSPG